MEGRDKLVDGLGLEFAGEKIRNNRMPAVPKNAGTESLRTTGQPTAAAGSQGSVVVQGLTMPSFQTFTGRQQMPLPFGPAAVASAATGTLPPMFPMQLPLTGQPPIQPASHPAGSMVPLLQRPPASAAAPLPDTQASRGTAYQPTALDPTTNATQDCVVKPPTLERSTPIQGSSALFAPQPQQTQVFQNVPLPPANGFGQSYLAMGFGFTPAQVPGMPPLCQVASMGVNKAIPTNAASMGLGSFLTMAQQQQLALPPPSRQQPAQPKDLVPTGAAGRPGQEAEIMQPPMQRQVSMDSPFPWEHCADMSSAGDQSMTMREPAAMVSAATTARARSVPAVKNYVQLLRSGTNPRQAQKNARSRDRSKKERELAESIRQKLEKDRTEEESNILAKFESRRSRKNNRSRRRAIERKEQLTAILNKPTNERSKAEQSFLDMQLARQNRKIEGDRLRRERARQLGLSWKTKPKEAGIKLTARGPMSDLLLEESIACTETVDSLDYHQKEPLRHPVTFGTRDDGSHGTLVHGDSKATSFEAFCQPLGEELEEKMEKSDSLHDLP